MNSKNIPSRHPEFRYEIFFVGNEKQPVLVVDNFLDRADFLVYVAENYGDFRKSRIFYPGIEVLVPDFYNQAIVCYLGDIIENTFGIQCNEIMSTFAIVTTPPDKLDHCQSRPHIDSPDSSQIAGIHYLCSPEKGGTSLYRHRATGFEVINEARLEQVTASFSQEIKDDSWKGKYINGSNNHYEQIASFDAAFNRLIMYRSNCLHSGNIAPDFSFDANPRTGRLTLTTFIKSTL